MRLNPSNTRALDPEQVSTLVRAASRRIVRVTLAAIVAIAVIVSMATIAYGQDGTTGGTGTEIGGDADASITVVTSPEVQDDADPGNIESNDDIGAGVEDDLSKDAPAEQWEYLSMLVIPYVVARIKRAAWDTQQQTMAMVAVSALVAIGGSWWRGELDNFAFTTTTLLHIVIGTQVAYRIMSQLPGTSTILTKLDHVGSGSPPT